MRCENCGALLVRGDNFGHIPYLELCENPDTHIDKICKYCWDLPELQESIALFKKTHYNEMAKKARCFK